MSSLPNIIIEDISFLLCFKVKRLHDILNLRGDHDYEEIIKFTHCNNDGDGGWNACSGEELITLYAYTLYFKRIRR